MLSVVTALLTAPGRAVDVNASAESNLPQGWRPLHLAANLRHHCMASLLCSMHEERDRFSFMLLHTYIAYAFIHTYN